MAQGMSTTRKWFGSPAGVGLAIACVGLFSALCWLALGSFEIGMAQALSIDTTSPNALAAVRTQPLPATATPEVTQARVEQLERLLESIKATGEMAENRSYQNKMMARELIRYVKIMVVVLVLIAVIFPLTIWLMSSRRILGLSGLSSEVAATLVVVEERQAKLANILKEIQGEIDYLHTMSVPDLKNLIQQAENYLKQNEKDLETAGARRNPPQ
jgi:hypothetical protein